MVVPDIGDFYIFACSWMQSVYLETYWTGGDVASSVNDVEDIVHALDRLQRITLDSSGSVSVPQTKVRTHLNGVTRDNGH